MELEPGAMREMHWHQVGDEWQYYISGRGRMTVFGSGGKARPFDYQAGDVGYVLYALGHYIEHIGTETLRFLEMVRSDHSADASLNRWMKLTPPELVRSRLTIEKAVLDGLPSWSRPVLPEWEQHS